MELKKEIMKKPKLLFIAGLTVTIYLIYSIILWIILFENNTGTFEEVKTLYLSFFPKFIQGARTLTFLNILLCLLSIVCFVFVKKYNKIRWINYTSVIILVINTIIILWLLFTLL